MINHYFTLKGNAAQPNLVQFSLENESSSFELNPSMKEILDKSVSIPVLEGSSYIYFLLKNDEVVYVGQTIVSPEVRINQHIKEKDFDSYSSFLLPVGMSFNEINKIEAENIIRFEPFYNSSFPGNCGYATKGVLKMRHGVGHSTLKFLQKHRGLKSYGLTEKWGVIYKIDDVLKAVAEGV